MLRLHDLRRLARPLSTAKTRCGSICAPPPTSTTSSSTSRKSSRTNLTATSSRTTPASAPTSSRSTPEGMASGSRGPCTLRRNRALTVNGEPTWISFEEGVPGLQSLSELREHFLSDPDLEEDRLAGSTCKFLDLRPRTMRDLEQVPSPKAAKSDVLAASSIASALKRWFSGAGKVRGNSLGRRRFLEEAS